MNYEFANTVPNAVDPSGRQPCTPLNELLAPGAAGGQFFRRSGCLDLQEKLYTTLDTPTFYEVHACYDCAMDSITPTVESYEQGLRQAERDGMLGASPERVAYHINQFRSGFTAPQDQLAQFGSFITSGLLNGNGYLEGWSAGGALFLAGFQGGREIVYNFATFQRAEFGYGGAGFNNPQPKATVGASHYVGYVAGFVPYRLCGPGDPFSKFMEQYSGDFVVWSGGYSIGLGTGLVHFHSPGNSNEGVRGQASVISVGVGLGVGVSVLTYARTYQYEKSYIGRDGKVDIASLEWDIRNGNGSPIEGNIFQSSLIPLPLYPEYLALARDEAIKAARIKAIEYNNSPTPCSNSC